MILEIQQRFLAWLVREIARALHPRSRPVEDNTVVAPGVNSQLSTRQGNRVRTRRQSNLNPRPGTVIAVTTEKLTTVPVPAVALGDTKRFVPPPIPQGGFVPPPTRYYPLDPPTPPVPIMAATNKFLDPVTSLFLNWLDPDFQFTRRAGESGLDSFQGNGGMYQRGINLTLPYAGGIINGVREYYGVSTPGLRNAWADPFVGAFGDRPYPNCLDSTYKEFPWPEVDGEIVCWAGGYTSGTNEVEPAIAPLMRVTEVDGAATEVGRVSHRTRVATLSLADPSAATHRWWWLRFRWYEGTLRLSYGMEVEVFTRDGYERYSDQDEARLRHNTEFHEMERAHEAHEDIIADVAAPASRSIGTISVRSETDESLGITTYFGSWNLSSGEWSRVMSNAEYEQAFGEPLPGLQSGYNAVDGVLFRETAYSSQTMRAFILGWWDNDLHLRELSALVPVMYEGALGTIPRPYATHSGTFAGIAYQADGTPGAEVMVCCDAFISDGHTWGVVLQQSMDRTQEDQVLTVSVDNEIIWTGTMRDIVPSEALGTWWKEEVYNGYDTAYPHQRFQMVGWPHRFGVLQVANTYVTVRPRLRHEGWISAPIVAIHNE